MKLNEESKNLFRITTEMLEVYHSSVIKSVKLVNSPLEGEGGLAICLRYPLSSPDLKRLLSSKSLSLPIETRCRLCRASFGNALHRRSVYPGLIVVPVRLRQRVPMQVALPDYGRRKRQRLLGVTFHRATRHGKSLPSRILASSRSSVGLLCSLSQPQAKIHVRKLPNDF